MKKEDIFNAIGEIDEAYIIEATEKRPRKTIMKKLTIGIIAAAILLIILLPNMNASVAHAWKKIPVLNYIMNVVLWRDYQTQEGRYEADIAVPQITIEAQEDTNPQVEQQLQQSIEEINLTIEEMTNQIIYTFEQSIIQDTNLEGADHIQVDYEVITDSDDYFCLKVWVAEYLGSGWVSEHYYTIDRHTGRIVMLSDLFIDDNYVEIISAEIKKQMAEQMAADENIYYWLDDKEAPDINFKEISTDQNFYIDEAGSLIICFNEGDVAPMYMGCVNFKMPSNIWNRDIR